MDRDHLTRLIDDPARVQRDDIADLKTMTERYPWFSAAHLLLAVGGHREGDVLFDEQLRASAAHLPSRAVLFDRLHKPMPTVPITLLHEPAQKAKTPDAPVVPHPVEVVVIVSAPIAALPVEEVVLAPPVVASSPLLDLVTDPDPEVVVHEAPVLDPSAEDPLPDAPEGVIAATVEASAPAPPVEPLPLRQHVPTPWKERLLRGDRDEEELDRQMRDSAVAISYELLLESEGLLATPRAEPVPSATPEPAQQELRPLVVAKSIVTSSRRFTDWLSEGSTETDSARLVVTKELSPAPIPFRPQVGTPVDPVIVQALQQPGPVANKHTPETQETKALIERFLQQNTQTVQPAKKAEFFNPQTAAKRSLEEHADLVTETLARIYEKQGNIAKAIAAYERLAVKHPEKSAHFRGLAKALTGR